MRYGEHFSTLRTPQTQSARADQVQNNTGGFVFAANLWTCLDRFLILGSEGGTYYVGEHKLTVENARNVQACIEADGLRVVRRIVEISDAGRAPKNDPAIFALAMCAGAKAPETRAAALAALPRVCRIGTHLFHFVTDVEGFRGWGRSLQRAVSKWYLDMPIDKLTLQVIKYQQRDGCSHKDVLRRAHPSSTDGVRNAIFSWVAGRPLTAELSEPVQLHGKGRKYVRPLEMNLPASILAFEAIHTPGITPAVAVSLIRQNKLPHECVPNELKSRPEIWEALLENMGMTAVIRNLAKMTAVGLLGPMSAATQRVVSLLSDKAALFSGRVHPMSVLLAMKTYASGHGHKGNLTWRPVREVIDALDDAFYASFEAIEPTGKRFLLGIDVSGSMDSPIAGTNISCREGSAAMAMVIARSEKNWHAMGFGHEFVPLAISPRQRLDDVVRAMQLPFQRTDCALPIMYALIKKIPVDTFVVLTDNETYHGAVHPFEAMKQYRKHMGINAKLVVVGMAANRFTIADPSDAGMLDVVGFDAAAPGIITDFAADREVHP